MNIRFDRFFLTCALFFLSVLVFGSAAFWSISAREQAHPVALAGLTIDYPLNGSISTIRM